MEGDVLMGTKIIETGSTAGGIAKVEYKDEAGNALWYYDDAGNFVRNGNTKITGLAGAGSRMVVTDSNGNLNSTDRFKVNAIPLINASGGQRPENMIPYDVSFHWRNDTTLRIDMKGSDGVLRSVDLTLTV